MKNNMNRKIALILALAFILTLFGGCQINSEDIDDTDDTAQRITLEWYVHYSWFHGNWGDDAVSKEISAITGYDIEYIIPIGSENEYLRTLIATGTLPDLLTIPWSDQMFNELLLEEAIVSLSDLSVENGHAAIFDTLAPGTREWYTNENGEIYGYPNATFPMNGATESNRTFLVRKDIYEAIGSPDMSTPEGFLTALGDAKEAFPTVGEKPLIPLGLQEFNEYGNASLEDYLQDFLAAEYEIDGKVNDRFLSSDSKTWLKMLNEANNLGLMPVDIFADTRVQMEEKIEQGRYFAMLYQWSDCQAQLKKLYETNPEMQYIAIDGPKNANGDDHMLSAQGIQGWTLTSIAKNSEYQYEAFELMSFLASDAGQKLIFSGVENNGYTMVEGELIFDEEYFDLLYTDRRAFDLKYGADATHWPMMNDYYALENGYIPPDFPYLAEIIDWTEQYATDNSLYAFSLDPTSQEAMIDAENSRKKGELLPKLILAESEEEFDALWAEYEVWLTEINYEVLIEELQKQLEENKEILGVE